MSESDKWRDKYYNKQFIDLNKYLDEDNIKILNKLGITIEQKIYTEYEYDILEQKVLEYYKDEDTDEEELQYVKSLEDRGVSNEEYQNLLKIFDKITLEEK